MRRIFRERNEKHTKYENCQFQFQKEQIELMDIFENRCRKRWNENRKITGTILMCVKNK